jgi:hypothetical protein
MVRTMNTAHDRKALEEADLKRIIKIPTGKYSATDFDLALADRDWLTTADTRPPVSSWIAGAGTTISLNARL